MDVFYTDRARKDLKQLNLQLAQRIIKKVHFFSQQTNPVQFAKPLHNFALGQYRFRVGDYRVIFDIDKRQVVHILMVLRVKHRKEVYEL